MLALLLAGFMAAAAPSPLETARNAEDRPALEKIAGEYSAAAEKASNDADAQYRGALACSYLAEVAIELHDRKGGQAAAERGIKFGERAVALKPDAEFYRILGTLYGQAVIDLRSGLYYGPKAKEAIAKAVEKAPKSSAVYVARGVGNYYLPEMLGGGAKAASDDFHKAIELDPKNAEAYLWLGLALRKENKEAEARRAFTRSLELNPERFWTRQQLAKTPAK